MIIVSLFLVTALIFVMSYKYLVPKFSEGVIVTEGSVPKLLALGAAMTLLSWVGLILIAVLLSIAVIPLTTLIINSTGATDPSAKTLMIMATICLLIATQGANWLAAMLTARLIPDVLRVENSRAAFKAAWAPTIFTMAIYSLVFLAPMALILFGHLNVH